MIGLMFRLPGLLFDGITDVNQMVVGWGSMVTYSGLPLAFEQGGIYGVFSYALFGLAAELANQVPRFWWAPYKLMEITFEVGILFCLSALLGERRRLAFIAYWLNPFFIHHGAWQGFWDGSYTFTGLASILVLIRVRGARLSWVLCGALLMVGAFLKPQGLLYFVVPVGIYLFFLATLREKSPFTHFVFGLLSVLAIATSALVVAGGTILDIPGNYLDVAAVMPNLCNECISIWRPVTKVLQVMTAQTGPTFTLQLPALVSAMLNALAFSAAFALVVSFILFSMPNESASSARDIPARITMWLKGLVNRIVKNESPERAPYQSVLFVIAFSALVVPQIATHAHINHTYAGLVLLIPIALGNRRVLLPWVTMMGIQFYTHLIMYGIGLAIVVPGTFGNFAPARLLVESIYATRQEYGALLQFQGTVNQFVQDRLIYRPLEPVLSLLSVIQFVCVLIVIRELFHNASPSPLAKGRRLTSVSEELATRSPQALDWLAVRFTKEELVARERIWETLCRHFFQKFVDKTATVLDLGAGHCDFSNHIECAEKYAIDTRGLALAHANRKVNTVVASCLNLRMFRDDFFDLVFASNLFEHLPSKLAIIQALQETKRVLKPGGLLMVLQPNIRFCSRNYWDDFSHEQPLSDESMREALLASGYEIMTLVPRFLPFSAKSGLPKSPVLIRLYLAVPLAWRLFGRQMLIVAKATQQV